MVLVFNNGSPAKQSNYPGLRDASQHGKVNHRRFQDVGHTRTKEVQKGRLSPCLFAAYAG